MRETILVVEDEFLIALELQEMLEAHGWHVIGPAARVAQALALLERALPTVALLDVNLAGEPVTPVAEVLKASDVPFIVTSAYDRPERYGGEVLAGAPNAGKPTNEGRILAALELTGCKPQNR
jgi:DNA-binding response OmpR family regulator